ncbi:MAG: acyl-[acyl-carrier-protein] thioesterase [Candidatus Ventricola sp.]
MIKQYSETFIVRATDCDVQRRMRPAALFVAMQEGGERHAVSLGVGYDAMMARGLFFALTRIHVRFVRAPRCGERVVHTTWPGISNRFFCPRYHTFTLEDGTPLASAGALWVMLDVNDRKIVSPNTVDLDFPDTSDIPSPIDLPTRLPHLGQATEQLTRTPTYSDYDINGHVNNTRYIGFLCDALGHEALHGHYLGDLVAGYEKEIREPRPLALSLSRDGDHFTFLIASESGEKHFVAGGTLREEA